MSPKRHFDEPSRTGDSLIRYLNTVVERGIKTLDVGSRAAGMASSLASIQELDGYCLMSPGKPGKPGSKLDTEEPAVGFVRMPDGTWTMRDDLPVHDPGTDYNQEPYDIDEG